MKKKLVLIGGGGHCKSVIDVAMRMKSFCEIVITDNNTSCAKEILGCKVVGNDDILLKLFSNGFRYAFITVGNIKNLIQRQNIYEKIKNIGFDFPVIVDPSASIAESANISEGVFVGKNVVINSEAKVKKMAIINTGAIIEHECIIEDFAHIAVGAVICGRVNIGKNTLIGANATILQGLNIGRNSTIGAGAVVSKSLPSMCTAIGVPAREI